jgi:hypothetical protein
MKLSRLIPLLFVAFVCMPALHSQNVGIGTSTPLARLHVTDSNVVFSTAGVQAITPGDPPISGAGRRLMWYADKGAFRAGYVAGTEWDKDNIGLHSFATGRSTKASGNYSFASGEKSAATGIGAIAMGWEALASGGWSVALGSSASATRGNAFAMGIGAKAKGEFSTAFGYGINNGAYSCFTVGLFNDSMPNSDPDSWVATDPIFMVGNGTNSISRSNAFTVLKNGNTAIGHSNPANRLHITGGGDANYGNNSGFITLGNLTGTNLVFDNNEILARNSGRKSTLFLNIDSGDIIMASAGEGNIGIGTNAPRGRLHVQEGSVVFSAAGDIPVDKALLPDSGAGRRMMWYADKAAFRAGYVSGSDWNQNLIGNYSFATGYNSRATGQYAAAFGQNCSASGSASLAGGTFSIASGANAFAFGSNATSSGGFALGTNVSANGGFALGYDISGTNTGEFISRFNNGYRLLTAGGSFGVWLPGNSNSWVALSDVNLKENFQPTDGEAMLEKIAAMPQYTWNYKGQDPKTLRHYGPMAQDFYKAFGKDDYGTIGCDTLINQQDFLGVNLVAIQALEKRTSTLQKQLEESLTQLAKAMEAIESQKQEIAALKEKTSLMAITSTNKKTK